MTVISGGKKLLLFQCEPLSILFPFSFFFFLRTAVAENNMEGN